MILLAVSLVLPFLEKLFYLHLKQIGVISDAEFGQLLYTFPLYRMPMYIEGMILFKFRKNQYGFHLEHNQLCNSILEIIVILGNLFFMLGFFDSINFISKYSNFIQSTLIGFWIYIFSFEKGVISAGLARLKIPDLSYEIYLIHYVLIVNCGFREKMPIWFGTSMYAYFAEVIIVTATTILLSLLWKRFVASNKSKS